MDIKELASLLKHAGVVGSGGAGFPTYAKLDQKANTIILNCAECEPLLKLHQQLMEQKASEILQALSFIANILGASEIIIGIKHHYVHAIHAIEAYMTEHPKVKLGLMDEIYPAGDEVVLIYELTKKVIAPGGLPIHQGIVVFNVETIYNTYLAIQDQQAVTSKLVSVVGEVERPLTVSVPIGVSLREVVALAGQTTTAEPVYFVGGPMMGSIGNAYDPVTKTTNAILVLPKDHLLVNMKRKNTSIDIKRAAACCCQCNMCTDICPRFLLGHPIEPNKFMMAAACKDVQNPDIFTNTFFCCSCGLCELYSCFQSLSPRKLMDEYKAGMRSHGLKPATDIPANRVNPAREYRRVPISRLMARVGLEKYQGDAPIKDVTLPIAKVKILMSQHIGAPAKPSVAVGEEVSPGTVVGQPQEQGLSVAVHASINGKVTKVTDKYVEIESSGGVKSW